MPACPAGPRVAVPINLMRPGLICSSSMRFAAVEMTSGASNAYARKSTLVSASAMFLLACYHFFVLPTGSISKRPESKR